MNLEIEKPINLVFDEPTHTYTNGDTGDIFRSVTTVIGDYQEDFKEDYWAMYTALKNAHFPVRPDKKLKVITVRNIPTKLSTLYDNQIFRRLAQEVKNDWKKKTEDSHIRGNKIHNYLEDTINTSKEENIDSKILPLSIKGRKEDSTELVVFRTKHDLDKTDLEETYLDIYIELLRYINLGCYLVAEKKIYTSKYMIAGMIDVLVVKGKRFAILDWKSNKDEMKFSAGYYPKVLKEGKWIKGTIFKPLNKKLAYPLDHLDSCKGIVYSLQLSLYAFIMELWGYKLVEGGLKIFHIRPRMKPKLINIKYYRQEVYNMLEDYKNGNNIENVNTKPKFGFGIS